MHTSCIAVGNTAIVFHQREFLSQVVNQSLKTDATWLSARTPVTTTRRGYMCCTVRVSLPVPALVLSSIPYTRLGWYALFQFSSLSTYVIAHRILGHLISELLPLPGVIKASPLSNLVCPSNHSIVSQAFLSEDKHCTSHFVSFLPKPKIRTGLINVLACYISFF